MKTIATFCFVFAPAILISQPTRLQDSSDYSMAFKLQPLSLAEGTFQFSFEKAFGKGFALDISLMGTYATRYGLAGNYLQEQALDAIDMDGQRIGYAGDMLTGWGLLLQGRNYFPLRGRENLSAPVGLYAGPQLMYRKIWITGENFSGDEITRNLDVVSTGIMLGGKFTIAGVLCIDIYAGGMLRISKYTDEANVTRYKPWGNIDYSGVLPTGGLTIGILR